MFREVDLSISRRQKDDLDANAFVLSRVMRVNIVVEDTYKFLDDFFASKGGHQAAVYINRSLGFFESAGKRDAKAGVLGFAGAVHHASHDSNFHFFDAGVTLFPNRHLLA